MRLVPFGAAVAALLLLSACATSGAQNKRGATSEPAASPSIVRIAVADMAYPPFSFRNASGTWAGFDVDLSRAVCEVERLTCETVAVPWKDLIQALVERRVDALWTSMQTTPERREIIDFTNVYYESIHALIGPASGATVPNMADPNSLKDKKIGVQTGTVSAAYAQRQLVGVGDVKLYATLDGALADLRPAALTMWRSS